MRNLRLHQYHNHFLFILCLSLSLFLFSRYGCFNGGRMAIPTDIDIPLRLICHFQRKTPDRNVCPHVSLVPLNLFVHRNPCGNTRRLRRHSVHMETHLVWNLVLAFVPCWVWIRSVRHGSLKAQRMSQRRSSLFICKLRTKSPQTTQAIIDDGWKT